MTTSKHVNSGTVGSVRYAIGQCSLGRVLVAASDDGVCAILLGDDAGSLVRDLEKRFPGAAPSEDGDIGRLAEKVARKIDSPAQPLDLALDLRGTEFQRRVWRALCEIPPGATASYKAIAERIGAPGAVRAVGRACASNAIAVAVPCHRVVRSDGGLSGYRWGIERKRALLAREAAA